VQKRTQNEPKRTQNEPNYRGFYFNLVCKYDTQAVLFKPAKATSNVQRFTTATISAEFAAHPCSIKTQEELRSL